ncbi:MAG: hypothetical protein AB7O57_12440 [Hyphomicrobiaceae bacterium]
MTERLKRLCDEIRGLEADEQAHVLSLLADLGAMPEPDVERAWKLEAERRFRAIAAESIEEAEPASSRDAVNAFLKR